MSEKISMIRRLRLEANALGEFQTYASRDYGKMLLDAADEIEQLRKERDEARRWICEQKASWTNRDAKWWAQVHTWDCFEREQGAGDPPPESPLDRLARLDEEVGF